MVIDKIWLCGCLLLSVVRLCVGFLDMLSMCRVLGVVVFCFVVIVVVYVVCRYDWILLFLCSFLVCISCDRIGSRLFSLSLDVGCV